MIVFTNMRQAGLLPLFLCEHDPRSAIEQLDANYVHGGGWRDFHGFTLRIDANGLARIEYPEDPPRYEVSRAKLRNEYIILFESDWVAVLQQDGSYRIARMD